MAIFGQMAKCTVKDKAGITLPSNERFSLLVFYFTPFSLLLFTITLCRFMSFPIKSSYGSRYPLAMLTLSSVSLSQG